jgi:DNA-binding transcriptional MerR regulator
VDQQTGYRRYATDQIPAAQVIRRFRLDMPLDEIQAVLAAPDLRTRNDLIAAHLSRLEEGLARTQSAVASLRDLLQHPSPAAPIGHRSVQAAPAAAICEVVDVKDAPVFATGTGVSASRTVNALVGHDEAGLVRGDDGLHPVAEP